MIHNNLSIQLTVSTDVHVSQNTIVVTAQLSSQGRYGGTSPQSYSYFSLDRILQDVPNEKIMEEVRRRGLLNLMKDYKTNTV